MKVDRLSGKNPIHNNFSIMKIFIFPFFKMEFLYKKKKLAKVNKWMCFSDKSERKQKKSHFFRERCKRKNF